MDQAMHNLGQSQVLSIWAYQGSKPFGSGEEIWNVPIGEPVVFQPVVADGKIFVGTDSGTLICIATGDENDDGWLMWGADAAHNGRIN